MTRPNRNQAPKGAAGTCRVRHRERSGRPAWTRPLVRASRAICASARLIGSTLKEVHASKRHLHRRPIRTSKRIHAATARLVDASARLRRAARELARLNECITRDPETAADVPKMLLETTESWVFVAQWLDEVAGNVFSLHRDVLHDLETGALVAERPPERCPRIVLVPRPAPVRAFLRLRRQPRVVDRIASILRRRRRTPRPAAVNVPPETDQGRAPPLSSICPL